jgi:hypothetical protein
MAAKNVTNVSKTPFGLPRGAIIPPGGTVLVKDWAKVEGNPTVKAWLDAKLLVVKPANEDEVDEKGSDPETLATTRTVEVPEDTNRFTPEEVSATSGAAPLGGETNAQPWRGGDKKKKS